MIICCGESLIDMVPEPTVSGNEGFVPYCGGSVFNTAIALGRLGADCGFISGISTDQFGDLLRAQLKNSGVSTDLAIIRDNLTCLACVKLDNGQASYTFYDEGSATRSLTPQELPSTLPDNVNALFFGGISLMVEPCGSFYQTLAERFSDHCLIAIDANIRADFLEDESAYRTRIDAMMAIADIIKLSDEDFCWLNKSDKVDERIIKDMIRGSDKMIIITRGSKGAQIYLDGRALLESTAVNADIVDTIGAGDTFDAAILYYLNTLKPLAKGRCNQYSDEEITEAMRFANKAAAVTVSRAGANPPWLNEIT